MAEIAESDLKAAADALYDPHVPGPKMVTGPVLLRVAGAIAAERERCAKIAESRADLTDYDIEPEAAVAESVTAKSIATSIRQGSPK